MKRLFFSKTTMVGYFLIALSICFMPFLNADIQAEQTTGLFYKNGAHPGYNLFTTFRGYTVFLLNNDGYVINEWEEPDRLSVGASVYLTEDGHLLKACFIGEVPGGTGEGGLIRKYDWENNIVWQYRYATETLNQHHDFKQLPNGNILITAYELLDDYGYPDPKGTLYESLVEVEPKYDQNCDTSSFNPSHDDPACGEIVWKWRQFEHLGIGPNKIALELGVNINAVDYDPDLDQILLSCNACNEIWIIDHSIEDTSGVEGDLLYRWGNPQNYLAGGDPNDQKSFFQHGVRWIKNDDFGYNGYNKSSGLGNILFFNNRKPGGSAIDEITPPLNPDGSYVQPSAGMAFGPEDLTWTYLLADGGFPSSPFLSNPQRFPNGSTLVCSGATGTFFEIKQNERAVWKYVNPLINPNSPNFPEPKPVDSDVVLLYDEDIPSALGLPPFFGATANFAFRMDRYAHSYFNSSIKKELKRKELLVEVPK